MTTLEECLGIDLQDIVVRMLGYAALQVGEDDSGVLQILEYEGKLTHSARQLGYHDLRDALLSALIIEAVFAEPVPIEEFPVVALAVKDQGVVVAAGLFVQVSRAEPVEEGPLLTSH